MRYCCSWTLEEMEGCKVIPVRCVVSETWGSQLLSNQDSAASDMR
jgi:hypothetical protein